MTKIAGPGSIDATFATEFQSRFAPPARVRPVSRRVVGGLVALCDGIGILVAGAAPVLLSAPLFSAGERDLALLCSLAGALLAVGFIKLSGGYRFEILRGRAHGTSLALWVWLLLAGLSAVGGLIMRPHGIVEWKWCAEWLLGSLVALLACRGVLGHLMAQWVATGRLTNFVAVVGVGEVGDRLLRRLDETPDIRIAGVYDDRHTRVPGHCAGHLVRGTTDDLLFDARHQRIDAVIVSLPLVADRRVGAMLAKLRQLPVSISLCPEWFDMQAGACAPDHVSGVPVLRAEERPMSDWRGIAKDIEDRVLGALILLLISPVLAAVAVAIKLGSPGPVFFRQKRYGYNNELIEVFKFRSMHHNLCDAKAEQLTRRGDPRVTKLGAILRKTSLDELPQFINVLRGEMSIVGPRPHALAAKAGGKLYPDAVPIYHARHRVKPGITGWAQVNGWRGETETVEQITKRVEHDLYYIEHWSVLLDIKIILRTILGGFSGSHAY